MQHFSTPGKILALLAHGEHRIGDAHKVKIQVIVATAVETPSTAVSKIIVINRRNGFSAALQ